ncbi:MAG: transporter [Mesorhizobium sp.]|nr:transporter [Mesorhizobium sp.]
MPSGDDIQAYLAGAWRLMMGKPDGVRALDVSADGFWNSFFAILVAFPALSVSWAALAAELSEDGLGSRYSILLRLAVIDVVAWVLPLLVLGLVARPAGILDRYPHFVVASNWASALLAWLMLPAGLLNLFAPEASDLNNTVSLVVFLAALVLSWRLTNAVLVKGAVVASAVFVGMVFAGIFLIVFLQGLFGLEGAQVPAG